MGVNYRAYGRAEGEGEMMAGLGSLAAQIAADGEPAIAEILTEQREETLHLEFKTTLVRDCIYSRRSQDAGRGNLWLCKC